MEDCDYHITQQPQYVKTLRENLDNSYPEHHLNLAPVPDRHGQLPDYIVRNNSPRLSSQVVCEDIEENLKGLVEALRLG